MKMINKKEKDDFSIYTKNYFNQKCNCNKPGILHKRNSSYISSSKCNSENNSDNEIRAIQKNLEKKSKDFVSSFEIQESFFSGRENEHNSEIYNKEDDDVETIKDIHNKSKEENTLLNNNILNLAKLNLNPASQHKKKLYSFNLSEIGPRLSLEKMNRMSKTLKNVETQIEESIYGSSYSSSAAKDCNEISEFSEANYKKENSALNSRLKKIGNNMPKFIERINQQIKQFSEFIKSKNVQKNTNRVTICQKFLNDSDVHNFSISSYLGSDKSANYQEVNKINKDKLIFENLNEFYIIFSKATKEANFQANFSIASIAIQTEDLLKVENKLTFDTFETNIIQNQKRENEENSIIKSQVKTIEILNQYIENNKKLYLDRLVQIIRE